MVCSEKFKGLWIPKEIILDKELSANEKVLLSIVIALCNNQEKSCRASNAYFSQMLHITNRRLQQLIASLKTKGLITSCNIYHEGTKYISHRVVKLTSLTSRNLLHLDNKEDIIDSIITNESMKKVFYEFKKYRIEKGKPLVKSSEKAAAENLMKLSKNKINIAQQVVRQTIENGWDGLFELKLNSNNLPVGIILKQENDGKYKGLNF